MTIKIQVQSTPEGAPYTINSDARRAPRIRVYRLNYHPGSGPAYIPEWRANLCTTIWEHPNLDFITCKLMAAYQVDFWRRYGELEDVHVAQRLINSLTEVQLYTESGSNILYPLGDHPAREVPVYYMNFTGQYYAVDVLPKIP